MDLAIRALQLAGREWCVCVQSRVQFPAACGSEYTLKVGRRTKPRYGIVEQLGITGGITIIQRHEVEPQNDKQFVRIYNVVQSTARVETN